MLGDGEEVDVRGRREGQKRIKGVSGIGNAGQGCQGWGGRGSTHHYCIMARLSSLAPPRTPAVVTGGGLAVEGKRLKINMNNSDGINEKGILPNNNDRIKEKGVVLINCGF